MTVLSNPEFLKEGAAVEDFMRPDRIIIGVDDDADGPARPAGHAERSTRRSIAITSACVVMGVRSAEFTKYAANAMLATRISFMNELANLADKVGADIESVRRGIGSDPRIGYDFLYAGTGYGGSCFPKDIRALVKSAEGHGQTLKVLDGGRVGQQRAEAGPGRQDRRAASAPTFLDAGSRSGVWHSSPTPMICARRPVAW